MRQRWWKREGRGEDHVASLPFLWPRAVVGRSAGGQRLGPFPLFHLGCSNSTGKGCCNHDLQLPLTLDSVLPGLSWGLTLPPLMKEPHKDE